MRPGEDPAPALAAAHRGWRRCWLIWAVLYAAGFGAIWAAGLAGDWPFYAWAIGGALAKAAWDGAARRAARRRDGDGAG